MPSMPKIFQRTPKVKPFDEKTWANGNKDRQAIVDKIEAARKSARDTIVAAQPNKDKKWKGFFAGLPLFLVGAIPGFLIGNKLKSEAFKNSERHGNSEGANKALEVAKSLGANVPAEYLAKLEGEKTKFNKMDDNRFRHGGVIGMLVFAYPGMAIGWLADKAMSHFANRSSEKAGDKVRNDLVRKVANSNTPSTKAAEVKPAVVAPAAAVAAKPAVVAAPAPAAVAPPVSQVAKLAAQAATPAAPAVAK